MYVPVGYRLALFRTKRARYFAPEVRGQAPPEWELRSNLGLPSPDPKQRALIRSARLWMKIRDAARPTKVLAEAPYFVLRLLPFLKTPLLLDCWREIQHGTVLASE